MRTRSTWPLALPLLVIAVTACAPTTAPSAAQPPSASPMATPDAAAAAARAQAQTWLDTVQLPEAAEWSPTPTGTFTSYQRWPCTPVEQLEAYWSVPDLSVAETAQWIDQHPPAGLVSVWSGAPEYPSDISEVNLGFTPADASYQGVVFSVRTRGAGAGVDVRAQIAAMTADAVCPTPPGGGQWGPPGMG